MRKPIIAVVGSLNMDIVVSMDRMPKVGETIHGSDVQYIPGGKGANQAVGSARLGAQVIMIGSVGKDVFGNQLLRQMEQEGIGTNHIRISDKPTGTAAILHTHDDNCIVVIPGANADCSPEWVREHAEAIRTADVLLVQLEVPLETVRTALTIAREAGVATVLNPAPAAKLDDELLALADYITPNETEFDTLTGEECADAAQLAGQMQRWQIKYGQTVLVTRGKLGTSYIQDGELRTAPAPEVKVVDTTGAGDCFNATFSYGIGMRWPLETAVPLAVKAASLSVTKFGAQAGMPFSSELL